jgi:hypothetical protein
MIFNEEKMIISILAKTQFQWGRSLPLSEGESAFSWKRRIHTMDHTYSISLFDPKETFTHPGVRVPAPHLSDQCFLAFL